MRLGLTVSLAVHAAVVLLAVVGFGSARRLQSASVDSIPVEIVTLGERTETRAGRRDGERDKEPATERKAQQAEAPREGPDKTKPKAEAPPPPPAAEKPRQTAEAVPEPPQAKPQPPKPVPARTEPAAAAVPELPQAKPKPPKAEPPKPEPRVAEAAPPEPPRARPKPPAPPKPQEVAARPRPQEAVAPTKQPERTFSADRIAALLDKREPAPAARADAPVESTASLGSAAGRGARLTASEIDAFRSQLARCWNPPTGVAGAEALVVRLRISLERDGNLAAAPQLVDVTPGPLSQVAAESAMRAVLRCQPFALPPEKFEVWRQIVVNFDPREMFGG